MCILYTGTHYTCHMGKYCIPHSLKLKTEIHTPLLPHPHQIRLSFPISVASSWPISAIFHVLSSFLRKAFSQLVYHKLSASGLAQSTNRYQIPTPFTTLRIFRAAYNILSREHWCCTSIWHDTYTSLEHGHSTKSITAATTTLISDRTDIVFPINISPIKLFWEHLSFQ